MNSNADSNCNYDFSNMNVISINYNVVTYIYNRIIYNISIIKIICMTVYLNTILVISSIYIFDRFYFDVNCNCNDVRINNIIAIYIYIIEF